jgi:hypothetical protein
MKEPTGWRWLPLTMGVIVLDQITKLLVVSSLARAHSLLDALLAGPLPDEDTSIRNALQFAMLTRDDALSEAQRDWLAVLRH